MNDTHDHSENFNDASPETGAANSGRDFIIGVAVNSGGKIGDYYWNNNDLRVGDLCVVGDENQPELGSVSLSRRPYKLICVKKKPLGKIIRAANKEDIKISEANAKKEKMALTFCRERVYEFDLKMSLSTVQYAFNGRKAVFYFTAESRVDFRELVKDLSNFTRVKVEMRQIGVRDEARMLGGCGPCGHELCCSKFLSDFTPVSIRMAKDQLLSLSPEKISGVCGRLMCCLAYEHETYKNLKKHFPKMGKMVETPDGKRGRVCQMSILEETVGVVFEDGVKKEYNVMELNRKPTGAESSNKGARRPEEMARKGPEQQPQGTSTVAPKRVDAPQERPRGRRTHKRSRKTGTEPLLSQDQNNQPPQQAPREEQKPSGNRARRMRRGRRRNPPKGD